MERSYRDLEARKSRAKDLEKLYMDMSMQKELQVKYIIHFQMHMTVSWYNFKHL